MQSLDNSRLKNNLQNIFWITTISLIFWETCAWIVGSESFPNTKVVLIDFMKLIRFSTFWGELIITLIISIISLVTALIFALLIGSLVVLFKQGDLATRRVFNFVRAIPSVVLLPLLIASIGSTIITALVLTIMVVTFLLLNYVIRGFQDIDSEIMDQATIMKMSAADRVRNVYIPSTVSALGTGLRLSANRAFGTVIAAGLVAGTPGLGLGLLLAQSSANYPRVFSYVFVMGIFGTLIYNLFTKIEKAFVKWKHLS